MSQAIVRKTLMEALKVYAEAHNPVLTMARENAAFTKPANGESFLEPFFIPAKTTSPNVAGNRRRFLGDFQINIWTKEGIGAGTAETIAEEIAQLFPVYPKAYLPVSVEEPASIKKPVLDPSGWLVTPVLISYRMEAEN